MTAQDFKLSVNDVHLAKDQSSLEPDMVYAVKWYPKHAGRTPDRSTWGFIHTSYTTHTINNLFTREIGMWYMFKISEKQWKGFFRLATVDIDTMIIELVQIGPTPFTTARLNEILSPSLSQTAQVWNETPESYADGLVVVNGLDAMWGEGQVNVPFPRSMDVACVIEAHALRSEGEKLVMVLAKVPKLDAAQKHWLEWYQGTVLPSKHMANCIREKNME
ncbi:hypothetical protein F4810DRAFT_643313 [Camillea tinctor]|nr:hypothetical protein F4810DRAFT_643313 [Camillea tinctor]